MEKLSVELLIYFVKLQVIFWSALGLETQSVAIICECAQHVRTVLRNLQSRFFFSRNSLDEMFHAKFFEKKFSFHRQKIAPKNFRQNIDFYKKIQRSHAILATK